MRAGLVWAVGMLFAAGAASATPVVFFDSTQTDTGAVLGVMSGANGGDGPLAQSFTTGAGSDWATLDAQLALSTNTGSPGDGSIVITLNADSGGAPGSVLQTLGTYTDYDILSLPGYLDTGNLQYTLAASTRYWIVVSDSYDLPNPPSDPTTTEWDTADVTASPNTNVAGEYAQYDGFVAAVDGDNAPMSMLVTGEVPEPASLALLGGALAALGAIRRRVGRGTDVQLDAG